MKKRFVRLLSVLLTVALTLSLAGCSSSNTEVTAKGYPADKLVDVIAKAQEERQAGKQVLVVRMNKNKKFQKEKLAAEGYKDIVEFFNN